MPPSAPHVSRSGAPIEMIEQGGAKTGFMKFGDRVRIEMRGLTGQTLFGA